MVDTTEALVTEKTTLTTETTETPATEKALVTEKTKEKVETKEVADTYELTMPEGVDKEVVTSAKDVFKELGLSKEQAQKLVDFQAAQSKKQLDSFEQLKENWKEAAQKDKEFGGEKFDESIKTARLALNKFGTPELFKVLDNYGIGNNPELIRFMVRVGKLTREDVPSKASKPVSASKSRIDILYPNQ